MCRMLENIVGHNLILVELSLNVLFQIELKDAATVAIVVLSSINTYELC
jgi:hypothetical protein